MEYDAFLSYSHRESALARRLSRRIRSYRPPRAAKLGRRRLSVFRDVERLTAAADLTTVLIDELRGARKLVLLASPDAAGSRYVNAELRAFLETHEIGDVVPALCRGEAHLALPPQYLSRAREALYIDLRNPRRAQYRNESLRLLAALFEVDYERLRREDELRRRWRRLGVLAAVVVGCFVVLSGYLITNTPAEAWTTVSPIPVEPFAEGLAPVEQYAVSRGSPSVVAWLGRNARYARDIPAATTWLPDNRPEGFAERAGRELSNLRGKPAATLRLTAVERERSAEMTVQVYAFSTPEMRFATTASIHSSNNDHATLDLTDHGGRDPFDLEPQPAELLREMGLLSPTVSGRLIDHTDGDAVLEVTFVRSVDESLTEVLDAVASPEYARLSSDRRMAERFHEEERDEAAIDLWDAMSRDGRWLFPTRPEVRAYPLHLDGSLIGEDRAAAVVQVVSQGLEPALGQAVIDHAPLADIYQLTIIRRPDVAIAALASLWDSHEVVQRPPIVHLFWSRAANRWRKIEVPFSREQAAAHDVLSLDQEQRTCLLVANREGVFRTADAGATWRNLNLRSGVLTQAKELRAMIAPGPEVYILAIRSTDADGDVNPLIRLERRSWAGRWRIGLAGVLLGDSSVPAPGP